MTRHKRLSLLAVLAALLLLFAACGGDDDSGGDGVASIDDSDSSDDSSDDDDGGGGSQGPSPEEQARAEDAALKYVECMRGEGIDMPDPDFSEGGGIGITMEAPGAGEPDQAAMDAANEKCQPLLEEGAPQRDMSPEERAELQDQLLEMAQCMRDRGHDFDDPVIDDNGGVMIGGPAAGGEPANGPPADQEQFEKDMEECNEEAGLGGGPGRRTSGDDSDDGSSST